MGLVRCICVPRQVPIQREDVIRVRSWWLYHCRVGERVGTHRHGWRAHWAATWCSLHQSCRAVWENSNWDSSKEKDCQPSFQCGFWRCQSQSDVQGREILVSCSRERFDISKWISPGWPREDGHMFLLLKEQEWRDGVWWICWPCKNLPQLRIQFLPETLFQLRWSNPDMVPRWAASIMIHEKQLSPYTGEASIQATTFVHGCTRRWRSSEHTSFRCRKICVSLWNHPDERKECSQCHVSRPREAGVCRSQSDLRKWW